MCVKMRLPPAGQPMLRNLAELGQPRAGAVDDAGAHPIHLADLVVAERRAVEHLGDRAEVEAAVGLAGVRPAALALAVEVERAVERRVQVVEEQRRRLQQLFSVRRDVAAATPPTARHTAPISTKARYASAADDR